MTDSSRGLRGGSWLGNELYLQSSSRLEYGPTNEFRNLGFRVATVPEPSRQLERDQSHLHPARIG